jgi:uncharacterized membrane protein
MNLNEAMEAIGRGVDTAGVLIIVVGAAASSVLFVGRARGGRFSEGYAAYRRSLGRAILLGLEFLVAGDIIRTVAITPTFGSVAVLGAIVLIRTFLSVALQVETEARWPWQPRDESPSPDRAS